MFWTFGFRGRPAEPLIEVLGELIDASSVGGAVFDLGSATFDMTRILTGQLDAYVDVGTRMIEEVPALRARFEQVGGGAVLNNSPYDLAAAVLCLQEAGAVVTDACGDPLARPAAARLGPRVPDVVRRGRQPAAARAHARLRRARNRTTGGCGLKMAQIGHPQSSLRKSSCRRRCPMNCLDRLRRLEAESAARRNPRCSPPLHSPNPQGQHPLLQPVSVGHKALGDYRHLVGRALVEEIHELAEPLQGKRVLHLSATAMGGGVSEILYALVPLMRDAGLECDWQIVLGREEFFNVTKMLHNALQGNPHGLTDEDWEIFDRYNKLNAGELDGDYDYVIVHDPQPAALRGYLTRPHRAAGSGAATSTSRLRTRTSLERMRADGRALRLQGLPPAEVRARRASTARSRSCRRRSTRCRRRTWRSRPRTPRSSATSSASTSTGR